MTPSERARREAKKHRALEQMKGGNDPTALSKIITHYGWFTRQAVWYLVSVRLRRRRGDFGDPKALRHAEQSAETYAATFDTNAGSVDVPAVGLGLETIAQGAGDQMPGGASEKLLALAGVGGGAFDFDDGPRGGVGRRRQGRPVEDRILPEIVTPGDLLAVVEIGNRGVDTGSVGAQRGTFVIFRCGVAVVCGYNFPISEKRRDEEGRQSEPKADSSHGAGHSEFVGTDRL
jgi:hypothetical protein